MVPGFAASGLLLRDQVVHQLRHYVHDSIGISRVKAAEVPSNPLPFLDVPLPMPCILALGAAVVVEATLGFVDDIGFHPIPTQPFPSGQGPADLDRSQAVLPLAPRTGPGAVWPGIFSNCWMGVSSYSFSLSCLAPSNRRYRIISWFEMLGFQFPAAGP